MYASVARNCDLNTILTIVLTACSLVACSEQSSSDEAVDPPSDLQNPLEKADSSSVPFIDSSSLPAPAKSEVTGNDLGLAAAVDTAQEEQEPRIGAASNENFCDGFVSHADSVVIAQLSKPDYLESYIDPAFGSRVVRITDSAFGEVNKPAYSSMQAWNSDESYILLYRTGTDGAGHKLLNGHTYEFIRDLDITPSDIEQVFWSHTDADIFYYISKRSADYGQLKQFNIATNSDLKLADFSDYCGSGLPSAGNDVQMQSVTDDLFGFSCQQDDGHFIMLSFQPSTGAVTTAPIGMGTSWTEWSAPVPAPSGDMLWHQGYVIRNDLQQVVYQLDMANPLEHGSIGQTHDGSDAYYQVAFNSSPNSCDGDLYKGVGHLVEHNLVTGGCRNIISEEHGYPYTTSGTHVSAQAYLQSERVAVSSIGRETHFTHFTNGIPAPALLSEVYVANTDPDDTKVCRLAHHRSFGKSATNGDYAPYFGEPHATISPTGTRVLFGSDWYDSGSVDSFVIELPDYNRP